MQEPPFAGVFLLECPRVKDSIMRKLQQKICEIQVNVTAEKKPYDTG